MASKLEALLRDGIMALRRSCNVNDVRGRRLQHFLQIGKAFRNAKAAPQLLRHEQFPIAKGNNFAIRNPMNRLHMLVGNFAATDYRDAKHSSRDVKPSNPSCRNRLTSSRF